MQVETSFRKLLGPYNVDALRDDPAVIFGVFSDFRLGCLNRAWFRFAAENAGEPQISRDWPLGRSILEAIAAPLQSHYVSNFRRSLHNLQPWMHVYECSSAATFREFQMTAYPLGRGDGLLIVNSLVVERAHDRTPSRALDEVYRDAHGIVHQCCYCRRFRRLSAHHDWDWIPEWVKRQPAQTSHGLCLPCFEHYFSAPSRLGHRPGLPFRP